MSARLVRAAAKVEKASEFMSVAAFVADEWFDGAVSAAVLAGINAADALMLLSAGAFQMHDSHDQAPRALKAQGFETEAKQLQRLLAMKTRAQYSADRCTEAQARDAVMRADRLVNSAKKYYEREKAKS